MGKLGFIIGVDKENTEKKYRVAIANVTNAKAEDVTNLHWEFEFKIMSEADIINSFKCGARWSNVDLDRQASNKKTLLVGNTGALSRFEDGKTKPAVIVSQIVDDTGLKGYRIITYTGKVTTLRVKDMVSYGERVSKEGGVPIQNAIFIQATADKKAYFKAYIENQFIVETIHKSKNKYTDVKKVNLEENSKALKSIKDIFSDEQIEQLKLGKKNGVNIKVYANPALSPNQMKILREGLQDKVNVSLIARPEFKEDAMQLYADDLRDGMDIKKYLNPEYSIAQISELALGYLAGLDIAKYANPKITASEMSEIRERLETGIWNSKDLALNQGWK